MAGVPSLMRSRRCTRAIAVLVAALAISLSLSGCGLFVVTEREDGLKRATPAELAAVLPTPVPSATPTPVPPTPTPEPTATPTPLPAVSPKEADAVVRAWFDALAAEDYTGIEELTADGATLHTRGLTEAIQWEANRERVELDIVNRHLDTRPGVRPERGESVEAEFQMDINALIGPFSFAARQILVSATFFVDRINDEVKIVDIRNVTGLPEVDVSPAR